MCDENPIYLHEGQFGDHQLALSPLCTIQQSHLRTLSYGQCRHRPILRGYAGTCPQERYLQHVSVCTVIIWDGTLGQLLPLLVMLLAKVDVPTIGILEFQTGTGYLLFTE